MKWKVIWLSLNIIVLLLGLYLRNIAPDGAIVFIYFIYLISFPMGLTVPFIWIFFDNFFAFDIYYETYPLLIDIFIPWIMFLILGYIQWFIIIPKIKNYFKKKKSIYSQIKFWCKKIFSNSTIAKKYGWRWN